MIINVLLFSEAIVAAGGGWEHWGRAQRSVSKRLGRGWEVGDVWLCIRCVIYKSDCTVLYCCVGEKCMHIFNKTFRVLREKKQPSESWGKRL